MGAFLEPKAPHAAAGAVDVAEELVRFTVLTRGHADQLVDRYSELKDRKEPVVTPAELARITGT